jgi:hypothetical protein
MRYVGSVIHMGKMEILFGRIDGRNCLKEVDVDGRIIIKVIFK